LLAGVAESPKAIFKFHDVTANRFLTHPISSCLTNWPRLEKGKCKKRAAGVPAASRATTVDLGGEEGGVARPQPSALIAAS